MNKEKITIKLEKLLNRKPTDKEIINAETDLLLNQQIALDEIQEIKSRLDKLEKIKLI